jgi:hypothetical protein
MLGAISKGVINKNGISSSIGLNSKYAMAARIRIPCQKEIKENNGRWNFLLKSISQGEFFSCWLPVSASIHRKD